MEDIYSNFDLVLSAFWLTIQLLVISGIASLVFGTVLAAMRVGPVSVLAKAGALYVSVIRNTPLLVVFIFVFVAMPKLELNFSSFLVKGAVSYTHLRAHETDSY